MPMAIMTCFALGSLRDASTCTGPSYSSDVVEAAQAQVLQEQELAMQQAIASNRCAALFFAAIYHMFELARLSIAQQVCCSSSASSISVSALVLA